MPPRGPERGRVCEDRNPVDGPLSRLIAGRPLPLSLCGLLSSAPPPPPLSRPRLRPSPATFDLARHARGAGSHVLRDFADDVAPRVRRRPPDPPRRRRRRPPQRPEPGKQERARGSGG